MRTEATFKPLAEYRRVTLAIAALWPTDALLRRIEREAQRANALALPWCAEQADAWVTRLEYEVIDSGTPLDPDRDQHGPWADFADPSTSGRAGRGREPAERAACWSA